MNDIVAHHPKMTELRTLVARLGLVSHISGVAYDAKIAKPTDEAKGGRRPAGSDVDRPRRPRPEASAEQWAAYHAEREGWESSYQRRTPDYFRSEVERCETVARLEVLVNEAREALERWHHTPGTQGGEPESMADPQWKRWVIEGNWSVDRIVNRYGCSRRWVHRLREKENHGFDHDDKEKVVWRGRVA